MNAPTVLDVARRQIGTVEQPPGSNRTPYGAAYGMDGAAWCAMFVWWCFRTAGLSALIPKSAYTPTLADWFRKRGQWGTVPRPGALVFYDFPNDGVDRISHVGLVESVNPDGSIVTIEGNTSSGTAGSQRDGEGVWRRTRRGGIVGYGYPLYSGAMVPPLGATPPAGQGRPVLRRGTSGRDVEFVQRYLGVVKAGDPGYGQYGPLTEAAVRRYQQLRGLTVDGVVGPQTWESMGQ